MIADAEVLRELRSRYITSEVKDSGFQRLNDSLGVSMFVGVPKGHHFSILFVTTKAPLVFADSVILTVSTLNGAQSGEIYTLLEVEKDVYNEILLALAIDLARCVADVDDEDLARGKLQTRYSMWRAVFSVAHHNMSVEVQRGLLGELLFLRDYMLNEYPSQKAIESWSGPKKTLKDFAFERYWYEIKTTKSTSSEIVISSAAQLEGPLPGELVVYRLDEVAPGYKNDSAATIYSVAHDIYMLIKDDPQSMADFMTRLLEVGFPVQELFEEQHQCLTKYTKFIVGPPTFYEVRDGFPRITSQSGFSEAITKIRYNLLLNMLSEFEVQGVLK